MKLFLFAIVVLVICIFLGPAVIENTGLVLGAALGIFFLFLALTNFETGLMILLFVIPLSVQLNVTSVKGGAPIDFGVDDFFIFCLFITWLVHIAKTGQSPFSPNPLTFPFIGYLAACVVSLLPLAMIGKGNIALSALHLVKWYEYVFIYFVLVNSLKTREQIVRFTVLAIGSAVLISFINLMQVIYGLVTGADTHFFKVATASFESNGILGAFYLFFLSIITSFIVTTEKGTTRFILGVLGGIMSFTLFYTFARGAYLGMVCALVFLGFLHHKKMLVFSLLMLSIVPVFTSKAVGERVSMTIHVDSSNLKDFGIQQRGGMKGYQAYQAGGRTFQLDQSSAERFYQWAKARKAIDQNPIIGTGYWGGRYLGVYGFTTIHNHYLTTLIETGIFGLASFLWLSWSLIADAAFFASKTGDPFYCAIARGLAAGYFGVLVHCFFGESFESFRLTGPLWIMCGIVFAAKKVYWDSVTEYYLQQQNQAGAA